MASIVQISKTHFINLDDIREVVENTDGGDGFELTVYWRDANDAVSTNFQGTEAEKLMELLTLDSEATISNLCNLASQQEPKKFSRLMS